MLWKKITKKHFVLLSIFTLIFFVTRIPMLGKDVINPDGVNWHVRSEQFVVGLKTGQFEKTYQHYHPGVTLTWLVGTTAEILKQVSPANTIYTSENYLLFHTAAKIVIVGSHFILSLLIMKFLYLIFLSSKFLISDKAFEVALFTVSLFSLEPFFLGNSRLVHLDVLLSLLLFLALCVFFYGLRYGKNS